MKLAPEVADVLSRARIEGQSLFLPASQLDRKLYQRVNAAIEAMGGKWSKRFQAHVFPDGTDIGGALSQALDSGSYTDPKKEFEVFETPSAVVERLVDLSRLKDRVGSRVRFRVLEPSAGRGAIASYLRSHFGISPFCCELMPDNQKLLTRLGFDVVADNFLAYEPDTGFDLIVANPPFSKGQDVDHVRHMFELLVPGGRLVSVMSIGWRFRNDRKFSSFRDWAENHDAEWVELEEGAFKLSGTGVKTGIVVIDKLEENLMAQPESDWQLNTATLKPKMIIRLPGERSELGTVYGVSGDQAKYRDQNGHSVTIPASAEVEFRWPKKAAAQDGNSKSAAHPEPAPVPVAPRPDTAPPAAEPPATPAKRSRTKDQSRASKMDEEREKFNKAREEKKAAREREQQEQLDLAPVVPFVAEEEVEPIAALDQPDDMLPSSPDTAQPVDEPEPTPEEKPAMPASNTTLTLPEIAKQIGVSYGTLVRYARENISRLPFEGEGRNRRFYPEAIAIFQDIKAGAKPGRKPGQAAASTNRNPSKRPNPPKRYINQESQSQRTQKQAAGNASSSTIGTSSKPNGNGSLLNHLENAIAAATADRDRLDSLIDALSQQRDKLISG